MQFQVPQFIEVEDKIFGPFTFKQFLYFAGGGGLSFILWRYLPLIASAPLIAGILGLTAAFALGQWNGRPFILGIEHGFYYLIGSKLYLWSHERKQKKTKTDIEKQLSPQQTTYIPKLSESRLHKLAWSLDIQEKLRGIEERRTAPDSIIGTPKDATIPSIRTARDALDS